MIGTITKEKKCRMKHDQIIAVFEDNYLEDLCLSTKNSNLTFRTRERYLLMKPPQNILWIVWLDCDLESVLLFFQFEITIFPVTNFPSDRCRPLSFHLVFFFFFSSVVTFSSNISWFIFFLKCVMHWSYEMTS